MKNDLHKLACEIVDECLSYASQNPAVLKLDWVYYLELTEIIEKILKRENK